MPHDFTALIPPELLAPTPRKIVKRPFEGGSFKIRFVLFLLFKLWLLPPALLGLCAGEWLLLNYGPVSEGRVTKLYTTLFKEGGSRYQVRYSYLLDGVETETGQGVQPETYRQLTEGQPLPVRYIHFGPCSYSEPEIIREHLGTESMKLWLAALLSSMMLPLAWMMIERDRDLLRNGTPTMAMVYAKRLVPHKKLDAKRLFYTYASPKGEPINCFYDVPTAVYDEVTEGDLVCVVFDPKQPERNVIYAASDTHCVKEGEAPTPFKIAA